MLTRERKRKEQRERKRQTERKRERKCFLSKET